MNLAFAPFDRPQNHKQQINIKLQVHAHIRIPKKTTENGVHTCQQMVRLMGTQTFQRRSDSHEFNVDAINFRIYCKLQYAIQLHYKLIELVCLSLPSTSCPKSFNWFADGKNDDFFFLLFSNSLEFRLHGKNSMCNLLNSVLTSSSGALACQNEHFDLRSIACLSNLLWFKWHFHAFMQIRFFLFSVCLFSMWQ